MKKLFTPILISLLFFFLTSENIKAQYCTPSWSNQGSNWGVGTQYVQIGSIVQTSSWPNNIGTYSNYTTLSTNAPIGTAINYNIQVATGGLYTKFCIFIDFNNDGTFNTTDEWVVSSADLSPGSYAAGSFTIPVTASAGSKRMRVISDYSSTPLSCGVGYVAGECEDYTINLTVPTPMIVDSCKAVTLSTDTAFISQNFVKIIGVQIYTSGTVSPQVVKRLYFSTSPSTSASDIATARLYKNNNTLLTLADSIGAPVILPNGAFYFDLYKTLPSGVTNYYLAYDLAAGGTAYHIVDARCDSILFSGGMKYPLVTSPAGSRVLVTNANWNFFCVPTRVLQGNWGVGTILVQFGTINNITGTPAGPVIYSRYPNVIPTFYVQKTYPILIKSGTLNSPQYAYVYIDWNNDGVFGTGETAATFTGPSASTFTSNITIPCTATPGYHRMRVYSDYAYTPTGPCPATYFGECEDYIIYVPAETLPSVSWTTDTANYIGAPTKLTPIINTDGNIKYYWDLNNDASIDDSTTGTNPVYVHKFMSAGNIPVAMYAKLFGCTTTYISNIYVGTVKVVMPSAPVVNFIANLNSVTPQIPALLTDLTTEGPYKWKWKISPSIFNGQPTYTISPSDTSQNISVQFTMPGQFSVTLIATNALKTDSALKVNYIYVNSPKSMCIDAFSDEKSGYLYDEGGKYANYKDPTINVMYNGVSTLVKWCSFLIQPKCASSVTLSLLEMDINAYNINGGGCNNVNFGDYLAVYDGTSKSSRGLHLDFLDMYGSPIYPFGFQNVPGSNAARVPPYPTVTGTSGSLFIEMGINCMAVGSGFEAKWTTTLLTPSTPPKAVFSVPDTVYVNQTVNFDGLQSTGYLLEYAWDMNGDGFTDATTAKASYTFTTQGTYIVSLSANSCALSDKKYDTILILDPPTKPVVNFAADFVKASTQDIVNIFDRSSKSVYQWKWTITPSTFTYMNGTSSSSKDIQVQFTATGTYTVKLVATNAKGSDSLTKPGYILVYNICTPSVSNYNTDVGISDFTFSDALGNVLIHQASDISVTGYSNFANSQRATVVKTGKYTFNLKRNTSYNKITRTAWIDYNQDGQFTSSEIVFNDTNSSNQDLTQTITIPSTVISGLARMRIAANIGLLANTPCLPNYTGEFEDYSLDIRADIIKPIITLIGPDTLVINSCDIFVDPGYTATDNSIGIITSSVIPSGSVNNKVPAYYTLSYTVTDPSGNTTVKKRVVQVLPDIIPPVITITGNVNDIASVNKPYTDPGFTATDNCSGIQNTKTINTVNTSNLGVYTITYIVWDNALNYDTAIRTVTVVDTISPTILLVGDDTINVEVFTTLNDPGVTITDDYYTGLTATVSDNINFNKIGSYFRTYCVTDPSGNGPNCIDRVIRIQDNTKPTIALNGKDTIELDVNNNYNEPGVTYSDNYWANNNLILLTTGLVNPYTLGTYVLTYKIVDGSGNVSQTVTRIVKVVDKIAPQISLLGTTTVIIGRWQDFVDKGVKVLDNYYPTSSITIKKNEHGTYQNTLVSGLYSYTYSACDPSGNCSPDIIRNIYVQESTTSITEESINSYIKYYPNPVNTELNINIDLPEPMNIDIGIYNTLGEKVKDVHQGTIKNDLLKVNTQNLSSGIYYIRVDLNNSEQINKKFIITR